MKSKKPKGKAKKKSPKKSEKKGTVEEPKLKPSQVFNPASVPACKYDDWVNVEVSLIYWNFMNFSVLMRTNAQLYNIARESTVFLSVGASLLHHLSL